MVDRGPNWIKPIEEQLDVAGSYIMSRVINADPWEEPKDTTGLSYTKYLDLEDETEEPVADVEIEHINYVELEKRVISWLDDLAGDLLRSDERKKGIVENYMITPVDRVGSLSFLATSIALLVNEYITEEEYAERIADVSTQNLKHNLIFAHRLIFLERLGMKESDALYAICGLNEEQLAYNSWITEVDSTRVDQPPQISFRRTSLRAALDSLGLYDPDEEPPSPSELKLFR